uniref:Uncharacterized protein n=1 Tax=Mycobacterium riyadhense TaxID=486698 RepID=A0A653ECL2_9MYCO|nr:hypothetical protein BIN_B_00744 [Mycobacterium riyadhense]
MCHCCVAAVGLRSGRTILAKDIQRYCHCNRLMVSHVCPGMPVNHLQPTPQMAASALAGGDLMVEAPNRLLNVVTCSPDYAKAYATRRETYASTAAI